MTRSTAVRAARVATLAIALALASAALPAAAQEPPGLDGRVTHQTLLRTVEQSCVEVAIPRAVTAPGARALVPDRYGLFQAGAGAANLTVWDYACDRISVDGQQRARSVQVSLGAVRISTRDGVPAPDAASYYLLWIATDDPVLLARYRQLGLPAQPLDGSWSASDPAAGPYELSFTTGGSIAHTVSSVADAAPEPVPVTDSGITLYAEGDRSGEVVLAYENSLLGQASARITADFTAHSVLAPIIALPRLLTISGVVFPSGSVRGSWTVTVARSD